VVLSIAAVARYQFELAGRARWVYVVSAVVALYLNCFVGVVQAFQKFPSLNTLAPTQTTEPAFVAAQAVLLAIAAATAVVAVRRFKSPPR
jgi:succinate dehydrogenase/fumarate reductase cytochrome b subunit